ncbi:hypothetical protein LCGC14_0397310 [marine sediment metagenome]|uniref:Uncharacterized protein n=1 Tax=marine sediment metagenome TaxID=412755 RepID=A0A0F9W6Z6_9ZZZZ
MKAKKLTLIYCPNHPRAARKGHPLAGHVRAENHGECSVHGTVSVPKAGTQALKDSRGLWLPDGGRNIQVEHESGRVDAIVRPEPIVSKSKMPGPSE